jgi:hypothetical protein
MEDKPHKITSGVQNTLTERAGVTAAQDAFGKMGWFFREQPLIDFGIDAQVEIVQGGKPVGRLIALQIKSGTSYFAHKQGDNYRFYGQNEHLEYWLRHCLPVFLVLYNPKDKMLLWQRVERHLVHETENGWSIDVPAQNILDEGSAAFIANGISSDPSSQTRFAFAAGLDLMRRLEEGNEIYLSIGIWINKSLGFRGAEIFFDNYEKETPDLVVNTFAPVHDVKLIARKIFPWAKFEYVEPTLDGAGEVETHILRLELNDYAIQFLRLERFYDGAAAPPDFPDPIADEDAELSASDFYCDEPEE